MVVKKEEGKQKKRQKGGKGVERGGYLGLTCCLIAASNLRSTKTLGGRLEYSEKNKAPPARNN